MSEENSQQQPGTQPQQEPQQEPQQQPGTQPQQEPQQQNSGADAYRSIIEQQQAQISALMEQTKTLNDQIVSMVNNGAQFRDDNQQQQRQEPTVDIDALLDDKDYSLESLASEIGKRE